MKKKYMSKKINTTISKITKYNKKLHELKQQLKEELIDLIKEYCIKNDVSCEIIVGDYIDINKLSIENQEGNDGWRLYCNGLWALEYCDGDYGAFVNTLSSILDHIHCGTEILVDNFGEVVNSYDEIKKKLRDRAT